MPQFQRTVRLPRNPERLDSLPSVRSKRVPVLTPTEGYTASAPNPNRARTPTLMRLPARMPSEVQSRVSMFGWSRVEPQFTLTPVVRLNTFSRGAGPPTCSPESRKRFHAETKTSTPRTGIASPEATVMRSPGAHRRRVGDVIAEARVRDAEVELAVADGTVDTDAEAHLVGGGEPILDILHLEGREFGRAPHAPADAEVPADLDGLGVDSDIEQE